MITVIQDLAGSYLVRWPETAPEAITVGRQYIARQRALPVDQQLKDVPLATVEALLAQVEATSGTTVLSEADRATAAETLRLKIEQARPLVTLAVQRLKGHYAPNLAQLEHWGLPSWLGARGINIRKPNNPNAIIAFLRAYVAKESSLPLADQITEPPLATMQALLTELETAYTARNAARVQRKLGRHQRNQALQELCDWLETAGLILVRREGGVTPALQAHGFLVVEHIPSTPPTEAPPPPEGAPATNGTPAA